MWLNIKIKEEGKQSKCVETSYVILLQCNDSEHHLACNPLAPGRSEHISVHLVHTLVLLWKDTTRWFRYNNRPPDNQGGEIAQAQSH